MKISLGLVFLLVLYITCNAFAKKCKGKGDGGIIGGTKAKRGEFPWQILLYNNNPRGTGMCGGTIVSPRHVITAGHCITNDDRSGKNDPSNIEIYAGVLNLQKMGTKDVQKVPVKTIHNYTTWDPKTSVYELVVLTMQKNFTFTDAVQPLRPATKDDKTDLSGEEILASGWGTIDHYGNDGTTPDDLLWAKMIVAKECEQNWRGKDALFCARGANGENVCSGDSGGPIACKDSEGKNYLCGISSGSKCEKGQGQLGRVNFYDDFIKKAMKA